MFDLFAAIQEIEPTAIPLVGILATSVLMYLVGFMLGAPCSPCCGDPTCFLQSTDIVVFPLIYQNARCDWRNVSGSTWGVPGTDAVEFQSYFDTARTRGGDSVAGELLGSPDRCESICNESNFNPSYYFAGTVPTITFTLSIDGPPVIYKSYWSKLFPTSSEYLNNCFRYSSIASASGTYVLSYAGGSLFQYRTTFGVPGVGDMLDISASLHRCNNAIMWLVTVGFVSRSTASACSVSKTQGAAGALTCDESNVPITSQHKTVGCCRPHVFFHRAFCVKTGALCADKIVCQYPFDRGVTSYSIDPANVDGLNASGSISVFARLTTSGRDWDGDFYNPYPRPGVHLDAHRSCNCDSTGLLSIQQYHPGSYSITAS